jgi:hypothetical protein
MKTIYLIVLTPILAYLIMLLAGAYAWGYFSNGFDHYISVALALPFRLASLATPARWVTWAAFLIYWMVSLGLVFGLRGIARRFPLRRLHLPKP